MGKTDSIPFNKRLEPILLVDLSSESVQDSHRPTPISGPPIALQLFQTSYQLPPPPLAPISHPIMVLGRLAHYAFDALAISAVLAGIKKTTGFA